MNLLDKAVETIKKEQKSNPITREQYQKEVKKHIEKCQGKTIFSVYKVFE